MIKTIIFVLLISSSIDLSTQDMSTGVQVSIDQAYINQLIHYTLPSYMPETVNFSTINTSSSNFNLILENTKITQLSLDYLSTYASLDPNINGLNITISKY